MSTLNNTRPGPTPLTVRPREAAKLLGIGERKLYELTQEGQVPHVKLKRAVLYPVAGLRQWIHTNTRGG